MEANHKKILKAISLELRHLLEGYYDSDGKWQPGDLEQRLAAIGVRRDREPVPVDELAHLSDDDKNARTVVDAYLQLRDEAEVSREEAVAEFVRETAYTWANRLLCLRCMEARELIDEVILQKEAYGGRSLEHHRLAQRDPEACSGEDDGLFAVLDKVFTDQTEHLPLLFDPQSPGVALKPSPAVLKRCLALLSGTEAVRSQDPATGEVFQAPDALGWAYQYWNTEEKKRVFETVRTKKGAKIAGADIIPATQLYTEPYMVKFLVQNSLGATWMGMHPDSKLCEKWEYYVRDADRTPIEKKPMADVTFLDPACGSGHFLIEAFDLYYDMYAEEGELAEPEDICYSILEKNLFGIDIDARAVQIAEAALWMKAAERAFDFQGAATNLVAAVASHLKGDLWEEFLAGFEREPSVARVLRNFGQAMEHIDELGSLARPEEELRDIIHEEHATWERQVREQKEANFLFPEMVEDALSGHLPFQEISDQEFGDRLLYRTRAAMDAFTVKAREQGVFQHQLLGHETTTGFKLLHLLNNRYDVIAANPPYMGKRKQGELLRGHLSGKFKSSAEDLYSAFLERSTELLKSEGRMAYVTMYGYTCLPPFKKLRELLLRRTAIEILAHIGTYAFQELRDHVNGMLTIARVTKPTAKHQVAVIRCDHDDNKPDSLRSRNNCLSASQQTFAELPNQAFAYWFPPALLHRYSCHQSVSEFATVSLGLSAVDNGRLYRRHWEIAALTSKDWFPLMKGGQYDRWAGPVTWAARWRNSGANIKSLISQKYPYLNGKYEWKIHDEDCYFRKGLCYTNASSWGMGAREMPIGSLYDDTAPGIFSMETGPDVLACLLNSHAFALYARLVNPSVHLQPGDVRSIPVPTPNTEEERDIAFVASLCRRLKEHLVAEDPTASTFCPSRLFECSRADTLREAFRSFFIQHIEIASLLGWCDGLANAVASSVFVGLANIKKLTEEIAEPPGWLPLPENNTESLLSRFCQDDETISKLLHIADRCKFAELHGTTSTDAEEVRNSLMASLEKRSAADDWQAESRTNSSEDSEEGGSTGRTAVASQTIPEAISQEVGLNPLFVGSLLVNRDLLPTADLATHEVAFASNIGATFALMLLGHCWSSEVETGEQLREWADPDGIIPLTEGTDESTLLERVRKRMAVEFEGGDAASIEREFGEIMGKPLEKWLTMEFFKHHTKQFKKRPVAWQIQSSKFTARKKPAFACLVYYHKLDGDLLPKIRNQYVGPLRSRLETELRSIESVSSDSRSDRQEGRRGELEDQINELRDFDATLQKVITEGFASKELTKIVKDEPLDKWSSLDGVRSEPESQEDLLQQESRYFPDINDGVRVNIAPLQKAGLLAADVLTKKDVDKAIADRAQWRADERRWCRENKLPQPGWWPEAAE